MSNVVPFADGSRGDRRAKETVGRGLWAIPGVPHKGWACTAVDDLGPNEDDHVTCQMCQSAIIRYVHTMAHEHYPEVLGVGCVCAGNMEQDLQAPVVREAKYRSRAARRARWLDRAWRRSSKGNSWIKVDGYHIVLFPRMQRWSALITTPYGIKEQLRHLYPTENDAALAAFDAMCWLQDHGR